MTQRVVNYTYGTGNPVLPDGSIDVRDGIDNLQSFDIFMSADEDTYNQRDGEIVKTRAGAVRAVGIQRVGDFTTGCTVTERNQGVLYEAGGTVYVWLGALPKAVPPASSPATTGGIGPAGWLDIGDASAYGRITSELSSSSGTSLIGAEHSGTVEDHLHTIINVDPFIALAPRVIDGLHNARDYIASIGGGVGILSAKTYLLEDEYIPRDRVILQGQGWGWSWNGATTLKWAGGAGTGKAVVRSSKYPVGVEGQVNVNGTGLKDVVIDADGCDIGLHCYYNSHNSHFNRVVSRNATVANIYINKSWFVDYGDLMARDGKNKGIVIAKALYGETGDIVVNACKFGWLQLSANGVGVTAYDPSSLSDNGAGLVVGAANACHFPTVQLEGNYGVGMHTTASYPNSYGSIYTETNSISSTGEKCAIMNVGTSRAPQTIDTLFLGLAQTLKNNSKQGFHIQVCHRNDNINSFTGTEEIAVMNGNVPLMSATDVKKLIKFNRLIASHQNVNVRYTSSMESGTRFFLDEVLSYPRVTVVPRGTVTLASDLLVGIGSGPKQNYGKIFTANVPITIRHTVALTTGALTLQTGGALPTADTYFDFYIHSPMFAGGCVQSPSI